MYWCKPQRGKDMAFYNEKTNSYNHYIVSRCEGIGDFDLWWTFKGPFPECKDKNDG